MNETKLCPFCKESVPKNAIKCSHCHSDIRSWFRRHPIASFILILFIIGAISNAFNSNTTTEGVKSSEATTSEPTSNSLKNGERGYLFLKDGSDILVASGETNYDEMQKLLAVKDVSGLTQMLMKGEIFYVKSGTPVLCINGTMFSREVRIEGGQFSGQSGWVPMEWTSKTK